MLSLPLLHFTVNKYLQQFSMHCIIVFSIYALQMWIYMLCWSAHWDCCVSSCSHCFLCPNHFTTDTDSKVQPTVVHFTCLNSITVALHLSLHIFLLLSQQSVTSWLSVQKTGRLHHKRLSTIFGGGCFIKRHAQKVCMHACHKMENAKVSSS